MCSTLSPKGRSIQSRPSPRTLAHSPSHIGWGMRSTNCLGQTEDRRNSSFPAWLFSLTSPPRQARPGYTKHTTQPPLWRPCLQDGGLMTSIVLSLFICDLSPIKSVRTHFHQQNDNKLTWFDFIYKSIKWVSDIDKSHKTFCMQAGCFGVHLWTIKGAESAGTPSAFKQSMQPRLKLNIMSLYDCWLFHVHSFGSTAPSS